MLMLTMRAKQPAMCCPMIRQAHFEALTAMFFILPACNVTLSKK
jgi:hypothetical protein